MLERRPKSQTDRIGLSKSSDDKQRGRLFIAIVLLMTALAVILIRDRQFWFGSAEAPSADAEMTDSAPQASHPAPVEPARPPLVAAKPKQHKKPTLSKPNEIEPTVVTKRSVSPPLSVEVVTGEAFRKLHPGNEGLKVEIQSGSTSSFSKSATERAELSPGPLSHPLQRVRMSAEITRSPADAALYPVLGKQMRVQGSVVLQVLIGGDGFIQDLRVLSGPAILASAAREAVRQWRFKPYLQDGQPIDTLAQITVNFIISTS